jgi:hypothetical protein
LSQPREEGRNEGTEKEWNPEGLVASSRAKRAEMIGEALLVFPIGHHAAAAAPTIIIIILMVMIVTLE